MKYCSAKAKAVLAMLVYPVIFITLSSCSTFNCTRLEPYLGSETDLIAFAYTIADELSEMAYPRLMERNPKAPILVTTFVDNNDLTRTSAFGRIVQEHVRSRLVQLGYSVVDIKMTGQLQIEQKSGESMLSRDLSKLKQFTSAQAILVGTVSHTGRTLYVSTRLVNPTDNRVMSSSDYRLCMDDNILSMFGLEQATGGEEIAPPRQSVLNRILY